jgi:hypothetical protein
VVVVVHVDDCTIAAVSLSQLQKFKTEIQRYVEITDLGDTFSYYNQKEPQLIAISYNSQMTTTHSGTSY